MVGATPVAAAKISASIEDNSRAIPARTLPPRGIVGIQDNSRDVRDSLADMSQMDQLRLQELTDRRDKVLEAMSNIMKKWSEIERSVVDNLK